MSIFEFTSLDLDAPAIAESSGRSTRKSSSAMWDAKANTSYVFYFVTDYPKWTGNPDDPSWFGWKACYARNGLAGGIDLPAGLRSVPLTGDDDPLYEQIVPYTMQAGEKPNRPIAAKYGVNVVEILDDGKEYHKVLVFTRNRYQQMLATIKSWKEVSEDFSLLGRCFRLSISGQVTENVELTLVRDMPPITLPTPYDIPVLLKQMREDIEGRLPGFVAKEAESYLADAAIAEDALAPEEPPASYAAELYEAMRNDRLKLMLVKAGVPVGPKATREELIALAIQHQV